VYRGYYEYSRNTVASSALCSSIVSTVVRENLNGK
jgi:hypothetical protein